MDTSFKNSSMDKMEMGVRHFACNIELYHICDTPSIGFEDELCGVQTFPYPDH